MRAIYHKLLALLLVSVLGSMAVLGMQDDTIQAEAELSEGFMFPDGAVFRYPAGWDGESFEGLASVFNETQYITFLNYDFFARQGIDADMALADALRFDFETVYGVGTFDSDGVETLTVDGRDVARYEFVDEFDMSPAIVYAIAFSDGTFGLMYGYGTQEVAPDEALYLEVLATFDNIGLDKVVDMLVEEVALTESMRVVGEGEAATTETIPTVNYPDVWHIDATAASGATVVTEDDSVRVTFLPSEITEMLEIDADTPIEDAIDAAYTLLVAEFEDAPPLRQDYLHRFMLDEREAIRYDYFTNFQAEDETFYSLFVIQLSNGELGVAVMVMEDNVLPPHIEVLAMLASFNIEGEL